MDFRFLCFWYSITAQLSADQSIQMNALLQRPLKSLDFENPPRSYFGHVRPIEYLRVGTEHLKHFTELYLKCSDVDIIKEVKQMFNLS